MESNKALTGYPSIDKPWLKYYSEEAINAPLPELGLYDYLYSCNKDHMDDIAINYFGRKITFKKLFDMIDKAAKAFVSIGVKEGEIVPVVSVSTTASIVCFYALNRIGAVVDFINVLLEQADLARLFAEAHARTVVTLDLFEEKVAGAAAAAGVERIVSFGVDHEMPFAVKLGYRLKTGKKAAVCTAVPQTIKWNAFLSSAKNAPEIRFKKDPNKMCLLAHTGGTTGEPKGVMLNDSSLNTVVSQYISSAGIRRRDVFLSLIVPFVVYGALDNIHLPLCLGLQSVIIPKYDSKQWPEYLKKYRPNHMLAVPAYLNPILSNEKIVKMDLSYLITAGVGGEGMTAELETQLNSFLVVHNSSGKVLSGYGMTEICATATACFSYSCKPGSVGMPLPKNNLMIYDNERHKELGYNETGEVCLQGPSRMMGYMNNEQATRELFRIHEDGSEWLHTGDLGYVDEDGFLFIVGRMKRMIMTVKDGVTYKVFPILYEKILDENKAVTESCIVGFSDAGDQVLKAFVSVSKENLARNKEIEAELRAVCEKELPSYARPAYYEFCESLPLTAAGKVDYRALEKRAEEGRGNNEAQ